MVDPEWRVAHTMLDTVRSQIPGWSEKLPVNRNVWGRPILFSGGLGPDMVSPLYTRDASSNPLYIECVRLKLPIRKPDHKIGGVELTDQEYDWLVAQAGPPAEKFLTDVIVGKMAVNPTEFGEFKPEKMRIPKKPYTLLRDQNLMWSEMSDIERKSVITGTLRKTYEEWRGLLYEMILAENPRRATDPVAKEALRTVEQIYERRRPADTEGFYP